MDKQQANKSREPEVLKEFTGRIEGITASAQFRFDVAGKKSSRKSFSVPPGDTAMATLVTASYLAGKKISVTSIANGDATHIASKIRLGAKPKSEKTAAYPKKLKKAASENSTPTVTPQA